MKKSLILSFILLSLLFTSSCSSAIEGGSEKEIASIRSNLLED